MDRLRPVLESMPNTVQSRWEFAGVPTDWAMTWWGPPHHRSEDGLVLEYWFFRLENDALVWVELFPESQMLLVRSDSTDTRMLRLALGLQSVPGVEFKPPMSVSEAQQLAAASRQSGKPIPDAILDFEGHGAADWMVVDSVASAYGVTAALVRRSFDVLYASKMDYAHRSRRAYGL